MAHRSDQISTRNGIIKKSKKTIYMRLGYPSLGSTFSRPKYSRDRSYFKRSNRQYRRENSDDSKESEGRRVAGNR